MPILNQSKVVVLSIVLVHYEIAMMATYFIVCNSVKHFFKLTRQENHQIVVGCLPRAVFSNYFRESQKMKVALYLVP